MVSVAYPRERRHSCHDDGNVCGQAKGEDGVVFVKVVLARHDHLVGQPYDGRDGATGVNTTEMLEYAE